VGLAPVPSDAEIVRLYQAGDLSGELARFHELDEGQRDPFIQKCIALHNRGDINLIAVPSEPAFAKIDKHAFFAAQHLYCEAIPKLRTNARALMGCCRILIEQAGSDGAANEPNGAFRAWCKCNPADGVAVIRDARAGDALSKYFATFALQAANDHNGALEFVTNFTDDRRLSGMTALAGMVFSDAMTAHGAIDVLAPFVADEDDNVRINALLSALGILRQYPDVAIARNLIDRAAKKTGPQTCHGLARAVWLHQSLLNDEALQIALTALLAIDPKNLGTVREIDMGLRQLLGSPREALALEYLTAKLQDSALAVDNFSSTAQELTSGNPQRLYELIVRWFLSGSIALCHNVNGLVAIDRDRAFDTAVQPLKLTPLEQIFLCRKAIGFLFIKPVVCCSIIISVLRAGVAEVEGPVAELLFDPMLLSYGGDARDYLKRIPENDRAYDAIQTALAKDTVFYAGLDAVGIIKELHPSDYQRDVVRQRTYDEMHTAHKLAETKSVLLSLVHRSTILYGRRSLTFVTDYDGSQRAVAMDLKSISTSFELPRREILDPVGLDYMLRVFRLEKLK
jgi:hypothetical protein